MKLDVLTFSVVLFCLTVFSFAQGTPSAMVDPKQEVAILSLSPGDFPVPESALSSIDGEIQSVFVGLGRFEVVGAPKRLTIKEIPLLVEAVKHSKAPSFAMTDEVPVGAQSFTAPEFDNLLKASIIVIPVVVGFSSEYNPRLLSYRSRVKVSFAFVGVQDGKVIAFRTLETTGDHLIDPRSAVRNAIDDIPDKLEYEIATIPDFQLARKILSVEGRKVTLVLGSDLGIIPSDEFSVLYPTVENGIRKDRFVGTIAVRETSPKQSIAWIEYADSPITPECELSEIVKVGIENEPYLHAIIGKGMRHPKFDKADPAALTWSDTTTTWVPGFRFGYTKLAYNLRPYVMFEAPLNGWYSGSPSVGAITYKTSASAFNVGLGLETTVYLSRFQLVPFAQFGIGLDTFSITNADTDTSVSKLSSKSALSALGGTVGVDAGYLLNDKVRLNASAGASYYGALDSTIERLWGSYGGFFVGLGATVSW